MAQGGLRGDSDLDHRSMGLAPPWPCCVSPSGQQPLRVLTSKFPGSLRGLVQLQSPPGLT